MIAPSFLSSIIEITILKGQKSTAILIREGIPEFHAAAFTTPNVEAYFVNIGSVGNFVTLSLFHLQQRHD